MGIGVCKRVNKWLRPPGGDVTLLSVVWCTLSAIVLWASLAARDIPAVAVALASLVLSLGLWFRQAWARWTLLAFCLGSIVFRCTMLV